MMIPFNFSGCSTDRQTRDGACRVPSRDWATHTRLSSVRWTAQVVGDDWKFKGKGANSSGDSFGAAPNIDHTAAAVKSGLSEWLRWLRSEIGFDGWRWGPPCPPRLKSLQCTLYGNHSSSCRQYPIDNAAADRVTPIRAVRNPSTEPDPMTLHSSLICASCLDSASSPLQPPNAAY